MTLRVVVAAPDAQLVSDIGAIASESSAFSVVGTAGNAGELVAQLGAPELDVVVMHEDLGPLPVLDLARDVAARAPQVGLVLLASEQSAEVFAGALRAGFRGVARLPLSLEDLQGTVRSAGTWAQAVRARLTGENENAVGGRMIAVAGAKGGVGTTTVAVHLALAAAAGQDRSVCLVDFDLQSGDVRSYLNLTHRRSVADLVEVAAELSAHQLEESLSVHSSGLRVLLPPVDGEQGEDVVEDVARRVLGGIRTRFDIVVVDVGAVVSEAGAAATEMADEVLVMATPDVPALRGANRLLALWERLQIRKEGVRVVVNRASRDGEVQPDLVAKIVTAPVHASTIGADFRALEAAANTGAPERVEDGHARRALAGLAEELDLVPQRRRGRRLSLRSDAGQVAVETAGLTLLIGIISLLLWEIVLVGFTFLLSNHGAREAARELAVTRLSADERVEHVTDVAVEDLPSGWRQAAEVDVAEDEVSLTLSVPLLAPGNRSPWRIEASAGTVIEQGGD